MNIRSAAERVRDNQFLVPALCIAANVALVATTNGLDGSGVGHPLAIESSLPAARTLLSTIAGATVTVAALVFSLSAVTMQLAASQYSPRVVQGFLRDRVQQVAFGIAMGTFTFALAALATLPAEDVDERGTDWTVTAAVVLAAMTAVVIVAFIDHVLRKVRIDDTVRTLAERTAQAFDPPRGPKPDLEQPWNLPEDTESVVIRAPKAGYVQAIDLDRLAESLQPGSVVRLDVWPGHFVTEGRRLATVWNGGDLDSRTVTSTIAVGDQRTIEQDPGFGIRQLVDIALRALSPGINDPATAADVVRQLAGCLRTAYLAGDPIRARQTDSGARLFMPRAPSIGDFVNEAITPIRRAAVEQPIALRAIVDALNGLVDELTERDIGTAELRGEIELASHHLQTIEAAESNLRDSSG